MTINEVIDALTKIRDDYGDVECVHNYGALGDSLYEVRFDPEDNRVVIG